MLTAKQIEEIRARADLVSNRIGKLASGAERFRMCIPPQPYDDDIAIATLARTDVLALLADNDALREEVRALRKVADEAKTCERIKTEAENIVNIKYLEMTDKEAEDKISGLGFMLGIHEHKLKKALAALKEPAPCA